MMPAVNYEPAGVMARIKKLDIGSLFKKKHNNNKKATLRSLGGLLRLSLFDDLTIQVKETSVKQQIGLPSFTPIQCWCLPDSPSLRK